ncbi:MAG TPA: hypothetical protein VL128_06855 [Candidatus Eisenbacteria bacterium]|nr:hypothetical protein [Candidatus Eisenbacteria bacterium]
MHSLERKPPRLALEGALWLWIIAAQVWYYHLYAPAISSTLRLVLRKLWH